jgi:hypothetical protein
MKPRKLKKFNYKPMRERLSPKITYIKNRRSPTLLFNFDTKSFSLLPDFLIKQKAHRLK